MVHHVWMASTATRATAQRDSLERTAIKVKSSGFHLCFDKCGVIYGTGERYGKHELAQFFLFWSERRVNVCVLNFP